MLKKEKEELKRGQQRKEEINELKEEILVKREQERYAGNIEVQEFVKRPTYYFVENGKSKSLKLKKKSILGLFSRHQSTLVSFAKKNRLKLNSESDLVTLLSYYEALTKPNEYSSAGQERE